MKRIMNLASGVIPFATRVGLLVLLGAVPDSAYGALAGSTLTSLIRDSDSILRARLFRSEMNADFSGTALLTLEQVYVGWVPKKTFSIAWPDDVESQRLLRVGEEYVLFLKRTGQETVEPAQYGRSYWPLEYVYRSDRKVTPLAALALLDIDVPHIVVPARLYVTELPRGMNPVEVPTIPLDLLIPAIRSILKNDRSSHELSNYGVQPSAARTAILTPTLAWRRRG